MPASRRAAITSVSPSSSRYAVNSCPLILSRLGLVETPSTEVPVPPVLMRRKVLSPRAVTLVVSNRARPSGVIRLMSAIRFRSIEFSLVVKVPLSTGTTTSVFGGRNQDRSLRNMSCAASAVAPPRQRVPSTTIDLRMTPPGKRDCRSNLSKNGGWRVGQSQQPGRDRGQKRDQERQEGGPEQDPRLRSWDSRHRARQRGRYHDSIEKEAQYAAHDPDPRRPDQNQPGHSPTGGAYPPPKRELPGD